MLNTQFDRPSKTLSAYAKCCDYLNIPTVGRFKKNNTYYFLSVNCLKKKKKKKKKKKERRQLRNQRFKFVI